MELQHSLTCELLEARTSGLKGAQSFLTTAGTLSSADVSSMVEDRVHGGFFRLKHALDGRTTIAHTRTKEVLCPTMVRSIRDSEDPLVVQIALQVWYDWVRRDGLSQYGM
jgi:hypothetical protein